MVGMGPGVLVGGGTGVTVGRAVAEGSAVGWALLVGFAARLSSSSESEAAITMATIIATTAMTPTEKMAIRCELFT